VNKEYKLQFAISSEFAPPRTSHISVTLTGAVPPGPFTFTAGGISGTDGVDRWNTWVTQTLVFTAKSGSVGFHFEHAGASGSGVGLDCIEIVPGMDHFKCYKVTDLKNPRFARIYGLPLADQFGPDSVTAVRPKFLCAPANKDGSGINDPTTHQCCYLIHPAIGANKPVEVADQFGTYRWQVKGAYLLCQPCMKKLLP
jgi:hypothetical protein